MNVKEFSLTLKGVSIVLEHEGLGLNSAAGNSISAGYSFEMSGNGFDSIVSDI